jgi:transposase
VERDGGVRPHDGRLGGGSGRAKDPHDRRDLSQGAPHGLEPAVEKGGPAAQRGRLIGRTKGGLNTKLHAVTDGDGRPLRFFLSAGQVSDYTGALALLSALPKADWLLADRGYDADWFREALANKGIKPCIPGRSSRDQPIKHDKRRYRRRHRIEMMFGRLKDWRRVATRYDRCPVVFLSAIALAATVMFWL